MPAHNLATTIPMNNGDNSGVSLNPISGMVMEPSGKLMEGVKILMGGMPAVKKLNLTGQNGVSPGAFGATLVPGQVKVMALA